MTHQLLFYYVPECVYCQKVLQYIKDNNLDVPIQNRDQTPLALSQLVKIAGRKFVPCLVVDGKAIAESDEIIRWLETNLVKSSVHTA